jgi:hypothetical protein
MDLQALLKNKQEELEACQAEFESEFELVKAKFEPKIERLKDEVSTLGKAIDLVNRESEVEDWLPIVRSGQRKKWGKLADGIRQVVKEIPPPITIQKVRERLDPSLYKNPASIFGTLRRLAEDGELVVIEKGGPGRGSLYRLPG